jgi:hypothetical protein
MPERELINSPRGDRYVRRDARGRFTSDQTVVAKSPGSDRRQKSKPSAPRAQERGGQRKS